jgi:hypothetical protein
MFDIYKHFLMNVKNLLCEEGHGLGYPLEIIYGLGCR